MPSDPTFSTLNQMQNGGDLWYVGGNFEVGGVGYTILDSVVSLATPALSFTFDTVPAGAIIDSVELHLITAITVATGSNQVGLGIAATPAKYAQTTAVTAGTKIAKLIAPVVLSAAEQIRLYAVTTAGNAGTGNIGGAGEAIRVRIVYRTAIGL